MYNVQIQPENYYFSLLLLFKPWRNTDELKNGFNTYAEAFLSLESQLTEAIQYHERITDIQEARDHIKCCAKTPGIEILGTNLGMLLGVLCDRRPRAPKIRVIMPGRKDSVWNPEVGDRCGLKSWNSP